MSDRTSESPLDPLRFLAARLVLGEVRTDELPDEATALLVEGLDSGSLRALAGQDRWDGIGLGTYLGMR